jgi:nitric oxide reductase large subunit
VHLRTLIAVLLVVLVVWFARIMRGMYRFNTNAPLPQQVVALQEGETFVGVMERRRGQYVWIGNEVGRYE